MGVNDIPDDLDLDALGAQYRDAKTAIGTHRQQQARAEVAFGEVAKTTIRQYGYLEQTAEVIAAREAVDQAVADVEWCKAAAVAAGELIKGQSLAVVLERNDANRSQAAASRQQTTALLDVPPARPPVTEG